MRDAFYGVRRFGDFAAHLGIPRAVLTERLKSLTAAEVLARVPAGPRRVLWHADDEAPVDATGHCTRCGAAVAAEDTVAAPGPGLAASDPAQDTVTVALSQPHRLLQPLRQ